ncbi:MAG: energy-coupling factor ABC transporter ATP-binding protein [Nesterenkonia sp.]
MSLEITQGTVAVVGANGSGKSSLLRLIAGLVEPSSGSITFAPGPPRTGFVFASPQAQIVMPVVAEDIEFSLKQAGLPRRQRRAAARQILEDMGLGERADSSVYELSSGERQKVALAGVLAVRPQLVLADEPTTLLDLANAQEFQHRLLSMEVPVVVATHDLELAAQAERVLVFDGGRLVADDEPAPALTFYRRLALGQHHRR